MYVVDDHDLKNLQVSSWKWHNLNDILLISY